MWRKLLRHSATSATSAMLSNQNWSFDFQGERMLEMNFCGLFEEV